MSTPPSTVTIWESGRLVLAPPRPSRFAGFRREHAIGAALLVLCAVVLALYVQVLERDVTRSAMRRDELHDRAVAEARCELMRPGDALVACRAILTGGQAVASARGVDDVPSDDAHDETGPVPTASLAAATSLAGLPQ